MFISTEEIQFHYLLASILATEKSAIGLTFIPWLRAMLFPSQCFIGYFCFRILQFLQDVPGLQFIFIYPTHDAFAT